MRQSEDKSLKEFFDLNDLYSKHAQSKLNEGFFGELFSGILKAFASLFGLNIKEASTATTTRSNGSFNSRVKEAVKSGDVKLPDGTDPEKIDWKKLDPEKVKSIVSKVVADEIEGVSEDVSALEGVPAFFEGTDKESGDIQEYDNLNDSDKKILSEEDSQVKENTPQVKKASKGVGSLLGLCRFIKSKVEDFDFTEPPETTTPGDLIQIAAYLSSRIEEGGFGEGTEEPEKVIAFAEKYSQANDFSIKKNDAKYTPSSNVEGEQGEAIEDVKKEIEESEISPEDVGALEKELEEIQPELDSAQEENPENAIDKLSEPAEELGIKPEELEDGLEDIDVLQDLIVKNKLKIADVIDQINVAEESLDGEEKPEEEKPEEEKPEEKAEEQQEELDPKEIEALDPADDIKSAEKEAELPKDGVTLSLQGWFDSLAKTSQKSLTAKGRMEKLRTGVFQAIDKSVEEVTKGVETAIGMWREENEEALIKSKRFAKKNFDSLQTLIPQMVAFILKKSNENTDILIFGEIRETVFKILNRRFSKKPRYSLKVILEQGPEKKQENPESNSEEAPAEEGNPEVEADPTDEIQSAGKSNLSAKDAVQKAMQDWGSSLSKTSQQTLKSKLRGQTLNDLVGVAVDDASAIVKQEVEKAIQAWRGEHEETLIKSKRFAKKNFDSLQSMIPDLVANIMTRANESRLGLTSGRIRKIVTKTLDRHFLVKSGLMVESSRWSTLAGIK